MGLDPAKLASATELGAVADHDGKKADVRAAIREAQKGGAHVSLDAFGQPLTMTNSILCLQPPEDD